MWLVEQAYISQINNVDELYDKTSKK
jgi:hypothetical protein